ncbi:MAG: NADH-quinone oxidoreductase subunit C [Nitrospinae bacterium]|nr:NADH-quinone oxidoreductase subunit C [Nitrospinota bacterium]
MTDTLHRALVADLRESNIIELPQGGATALRVPLPYFVRSAEVMKTAGARLAAEWGVDETPFGNGFAVWAAYNLGTEYLLVTAALDAAKPAFGTLTGQYLAAFRFERQIMSLMGLTVKGHPDPRPWIKHEDWPQDAYPLRKTCDASAPMPRVEGTYQWIPAVGEGVFEIPVGPVHAGIIEPGHFRFQAVGEKILNLEARLGYVHKGIEKRFESLSWQDAAKLAGRVSGDTTVAHALAYAMAVESAAGCAVPPRAQWLRGLLLERERMANHLADLAALCNDVAFAFGYYQFWNLRETMLRMNKTLFGHRLLMDAIVPGGVSVDLAEGAKEDIALEIHGVIAEFKRLMEIYDDNASLKDRLYGSGVFPQSAAFDLGVVGIAARASGQGLDARLQNPFPPYDTVVPKMHVLHSGDAHSRGWVRVEEVRDGARLIAEILAGMPTGATSAPLTAPAAGSAGFSAVEGWRGEILCWVQAGPDGGINRCMVRDPSAVNWLALEQSIKQDMVPDFPLVNKSFNNSYSGNDL